MLARPGHSAWRVCMSCGGRAKPLASIQRLTISHQARRSLNHNHRHHHHHHHQALPRKLTDRPARTRFAPSPTGFLHLGSLRTALFNYLLARATGGQFLLRLEDTDRTRIVPGAEQRLYADLSWAGLLWDEGPDVGGPYGPYRQSERLALYASHARRLLDAGRAYRCFCTREDLAASQLAAGAPNGDSAATTAGRYPGTCLTVSPAEAEERASRGEAHVIRFRSSTRPLAVPDLVYRGFRKRQMEDDFIIIKSDGFPTYHFANVVDDHLMEVTHVIRGAEWLVSTPMHCDLYGALGWDPPVFAHVGLLVNKDRQKLSKRNADIHIESYQDQHILPEALLDFVAHLGWRAPSKKGILTLDDLVKNFDLRFTKGDTITDLSKIQYYQVQHLSRLLEKDASEPQDRLGPLVDAVSDEIAAAAVDGDEGGSGGGGLHAALRAGDDAARRGYVRAALRLLGNKAWPLGGVVAQNRHLFWRPTGAQLAAALGPLRAATGRVAVDGGGEGVGAALRRFAQGLAAVDDWAADPLARAVAGLNAAVCCRSPEGADLPHAAYRLWRWFLLGSDAGPAVHSTLELLGREEAMARLNEAIDVLDGEDGECAAVEHCTNKV